MRYTFPYFTPKPEFVQPDYRKWAEVQIGMSRDEVVKKLGPPLEDRYRGGKTQHDAPYFSYGYLQMPMVPHPRTYNFLIGFDEDGVVRNKEDPFNGKFSADGSPTSPEIIIPNEHAIYSHYPRILDCRWYPSSGVYPMTYAVELGYGDLNDRPQFQDEQIEDELEIPFFMKMFGGGQPGRIRVKAKNEKGESDWSSFRHFSFTR